jgi:hypothetical protein
MTTTTTPDTRQLLGESDARQIAVEAYLYLYPLVMMDVTRRQMTNAEANTRVGFGPMNTFIHMRAFPPPEFRAVPWANFDTLYSLAWLDLTIEPLILSVPDTAGRFYLLPVQDMWTDAFAVPGKRTTGTGAAHFALMAPGWRGQLPAGIGRITAPTPVVWIIGRTQTNGSEDYPVVHRIQDGFTVTPLSRWGQPPAPVDVVIDPTIDMSTQPVEQVNQMPPGVFFAYAAELLKRHPAHPTDWSILARMRRIGFEPGDSFDIRTTDPTTRQALNDAPPAGLQMMRAKVPTLGPNVNGWQVTTDTMGVYGNYYLKRATLA